MAETRRFTATVAEGSRHRVTVPLPFDPDEVWGAKPRHHLTGTVDGRKVRAVVERGDDGPAIVLTPAWLRDHPVEIGASVRVVLTAEGPQRADLPADVAGALESEPEAAAFFDSLAQFYRKGYLTWIEATKRRPEERKIRIGRTVGWLKEGRKQRPRS
jgi:hypothetical protein